jgi:hypothetical protein
MEYHGLAVCQCLVGEETGQMQRPCEHERKKATIQRPVCTRKKEDDEHGEATQFAHVTLCWVPFVVATHTPEFCFDTLAHIWECHPIRHGLDK